MVELRPPCNTAPQTVMMRVFSCLVAYLDFFLQNTCMLLFVVHEELPVLLDRYGIALIEIAYCGDKV